MLPMREALMLIREHIAQLVGQALGVAYHGIDVGVRMSVYPIVNASLNFSIPLTIICQSLIQFLFLPSGHRLPSTKGQGRDGPQNQPLSL